MDYWTKSEDKSIEDLIQKRISLTVDIIKERFDTKSIMIHGSFSHGEGSVCKLENGFLVLGDFDFSFVCKNPVSKAKVRQISEELTKEFGFPVNVYQNRPDRYTNPISKHPGQRIIQPSVETYSRKYGSLVLYGKDYLDILPEIKSESIPVWEGLRLIFNRMGESLEFVTSPSSSNNCKSEIFQTYEFYKLVLATLEAILISNNKYHYSYERQVTIFSDSDKISNEIIALIPNYKNLINRAVEFKLRPHELDHNLNKLRHEVLEACDGVLRYVVNRLFGFTFSSYLDFQKRYLSNKGIKNYYMGPTSSLFFQNTMLLVNILKKKKRIPLRFIFNFHRPLNHLVVSTVIIVFFAEPRTGSDSFLLKLARANLSHFLNIKYKNLKVESELEYIRRKTHEVWSLGYI